jgi:hypothetical protein
MVTMTVRAAYQKDRTFVHKVRGVKAAKKVWEIQHYCNSNRAWELLDTEDISNTIYMKGDTLVAIAEY